MVGFYAVFSLNQTARFTDKSVNRAGYIQIYEIYWRCKNRCLAISFYVKNCTIFDV